MFVVQKIMRNHIPEKGRIFTLLLQSQEKGQHTYIRRCTYKTYMYVNTHASCMSPLKFGLDEKLRSNEQVPMYIGISLLTLVRPPYCWSRSGRYLGNSFSIKLAQVVIFYQCIDGTHEVEVSYICTYPDTTRSTSVFNWATVLVTMCTNQTSKDWSRVCLLHTC